MIGFIGNGNMGRAIIDGVISGKKMPPSQIIVADIDNDGLNFMAKKYGVSVTNDNKEAAKISDMLFLAVKPNVLYKVIEEIKTCIKDGAVIVSIAAGQSIDAITKAFGKKVKLVRVMPNTPALVGEGMSALSLSDTVTESDAKKVLSIFESFGKAEIVPEYQMDAVTGVSGSSPAYVFMMIEAMADAAVAEGMARNQAYTFAAQAVLGSAKMVLETRKHPAELKDMVCSPGGTTIEAVGVLEDEGFRNAIIKAIRACAKKSAELGN